MTFAKRLRFFGLGILLGSILSVILFGPEKFSCSGYLPESRVLAELQTKKWKIDSSLCTNSIFLSSDYIKDSLLTNATVNFSESEPRKKPCGLYSLYYPKKKSSYKIMVSKCDSTAQIETINKLQ